MEHNHLDITKAPIGVFDSGLGGISVLRALVREMPNENYFLAERFITSKKNIFLIGTENWMI